MIPVSDISSPSMASGAWRSGSFAEVARGRANASRGARTQSIMVFSDEHRPPDRARFPRHRSRTCWRGLPQPPPSEPGAEDARRRAARPRPAKTRRGRARGDAAAAPLGMAGAQPGGASVALRKLVDEARRANGDKDRIRARAGSRLSFHVRDGRQLAAFRGSVRALFADDRRRFAGLIADWPDDIRDHVVKLASAIAPSRSSSAIRALTVDTPIMNR